MDSKNGFFKAIISTIKFITAYAKCSFYGIIQNITGKKVYKWQKYAADFRRKYDNPAQNNYLIFLLALFFTLIIYISFLITTNTI